MYTGMGDKHNKASTAPSALDNATQPTFVGMLKIALLGDACVGKSSLVKVRGARVFSRVSSIYNLPKAFAEEALVSDESPYIRTIGVEFMVRRVILDAGDGNAPCYNLQVGEGNLSVFHASCCL